MGKNSEKTGLGRLLVKHQNQMIQQSKEKGRFYKSQHRKVMESVTEVSDIDTVMQRVDEEDLLLSVDRSVPNLLNLDTNSSTSDMTPEERRRLQKEEEVLHASSLQVPRRPPWNATMSVEELDSNERQAFLIWRRSLARLEENEKLVLTPFEKNLDIWRQLWRVVERSDLLVMVVDARDPLFYRCPDLEVYAREINEHKRTLLLVNKADLLPFSVRKKWAEYFRGHEILFVFWSAKAASAALEGKELSASWDTQDTRGKMDDPDIQICGRDELLSRLQSEAEKIVKMRVKLGSSSNEPSNAQSLGGNITGNTSSKSVIVGFVGYPNVGKSSTINALVGQKRAGVTSTPGKTKHFQTLTISDELTLCDCPGLVFPSFSSSRYEMIASGVLPIDRMTEHREAVQVVANRVPRHVIEDVYKINLPKPKPYELQSRPPLASELLRAYCASRGYVASGGLPDETRAARQILKNYIDGKLPHYEMPPGMHDGEGDLEEAVAAKLPEIQESDSSDVENPSDDEGGNAPGLDQVLDDLKSFDMANGLATKKVTVKKTNASNKHHKKPQRKKDRSWRVGNGDGDGDGMPVARYFQKPANTDPLKAI
ncbi:GTPase LSG1-2 [Tripterygium wilfordii]|uniref:GTPase LSG1-2 n=1 Tax=Tripterygium wilfordii TaxID=458696 RepID=UPI0018F859CD|nr:GTPase LSG1-2 [Tripterygium wilfordii]